MTSISSWGNADLEKMMNHDMPPSVACLSFNNRPDSHASLGASLVFDHEQQQQPRFPSCTTAQHFGTSCETLSTEFSTSTRTSVTAPLSSSNLSEASVDTPQIGAARGLPATPNHVLRQPRRIKSKRDSSSARGKEREGDGKTFAAPATAYYDSMIMDALPPNESQAVSTREVNVSGRITPFGMRDTDDWADLRHPSDHRTRSIDLERCRSSRRQHLHRTGSVSSRISETTTSGKKSRKKERRVSQDGTSSRHKNKSSSTRNDSPHPHHNKVSTRGPRRSFSVPVPHASSSRRDLQRHWDPEDQSVVSTNRHKATCDASSKSQWHQNPDEPSVFSTRSYDPFSYCTSKSPDAEDETVTSTKSHSVIYSKSCHRLRVLKSVGSCTEAAPRRSRGRAFQLSQAARSLSSRCLSGSPVKGKEDLSYILHQAVKVSERTNFHKSSSDILPSKGDGDRNARNAKKKKSQKETCDASLNSSKKVRSLRSCSDESPSKGRRLAASLHSSKKVRSLRSCSDGSPSKGRRRKSHSVGNKD